MAAPGSSTEFLDLVRRSQVVEEKRLEAYLQKLRAGGSFPNEPGKLAGILVRDGLLTQFQAEQILQGKWRRFTLGKYKVLERLGSGGMGTVYLCEHKVMRRRVAIKVLPTAKAADASSLERFYREARAAAALDHPNIVHAYDIDQDETLHFLVMEYVDGASLQELVKRGGALTPVRAAHYIRQAALGLDHAHQQGLVHRDIKPGNILVDRGGTVKILDMGLARFFHDEEDNLTRKYDENVLGTADYLAPEQAEDSHGVDIRADIYSLGLTFYFLLTGRPPYGEGTPAQKLIWQRTRQLRPVNAVRPDVPADLAAVVGRMIAKGPADRYQTPLEVAAALAPWTQEAIPPPPESEMPRLSLAATAPTNPGSEPTQISSHATGAPSSAPRKNWQVTGAAPPTPPPAVSSPRSAETRVNASTPTQGGAALRPAPVVQVVPPQAPAAQTAAPVPAVRPAEEEQVAWDRVTSDTEDPAGRFDTPPQAAPSGHPSSRRRARPGRAVPEESRRFWRLALVVGVLLVGALVGAGLLFGWFGGFSGGRPAATRPPLKVTRHATGEGIYRSVREALQSARPGDRIVLLDREHRERLRVEGAEGVRIEPADGVPVVWKPPTLREDVTPILQVANVRGLVIRGIKFHGEDHLPRLITLTGYCPDLTLENLTLEGFQKVGVAITNCSGEPGHPVRLLGITGRAGKEQPEAGIRFQANNPRVRPAENDLFVVKDCRFEGDEQRAVVVTPKSLGPQVQLDNATPRPN